MRSVTGIMKLGRAAYNQQKDEANCIKKTTSEENILNFKENWRKLISTSDVFDEDNCSKQELLVIDEHIDDFVINDEVNEVNEQNLENIFNDCSSILGKAHIFTNNSTFENINFTSAKIVTCSSPKDTNHINYPITVNNDEKKFEDVNLQGHIDTFKDASCTNYNDHSYSFKCDAIKYDANQLLPHVKQSDQKRGKFLNPCPDITIIHQRPTGNRTRGIIQNGNKLAPVKIFNKKIALRNTCAFDSIIEILASSYCNFEEFKEFVDMATKFNKNDFVLKTTFTYAKAGVSRSLYQQRANLFYTYILKKQTDIDEGSCVTNVCRLFEEMMEEYPSLTEKIYCSKCGYKKEKNRQTISVQTQPILKEGIQCLQNCIEKVVQNQKVNCEHCQEKCAISEKILSSYVCVDIEYIYQSMLQRAYGFSGNIKSNIRDIPIYLLLNNIRYVLSGVVQFIEPKIQEGLGHYVAYCRSVNNTWEKRDDMCKKAVYMGQNILNINIAFIFYVKCSE